MKRFYIQLALIFSLLISFNTSAQNWDEIIKAVASDAAASDQFGYSVAIDGDTAIVGARLDADAGNQSGSAYIFIRSGSSWIEQAKLTASDAAAFDQFGVSVAINGDTAIVGANQDGDAGDASGSAYIFTRSSSSWSEQAKLTASDAAAYDFFGVKVAISGDTAIVGAYYNDDAGDASGSAYIFTRSGPSWSEQAKLTASDAAAYDFFGVSVAISGDTAIVGAYQDEDAGNDSGSAYIFIRSGSSWSEQAKLTASDASSNDYFGYSVAISGDTAIVGAWLNDDAGTSSGSAYIFTRSGSSWSEQTKLTASDAAANDRFGISVAVSGDTAIVGAYVDDDAGTNSGSAYIFTRSGSSWSEHPKLTASDAAVSDLFGFSVAISGDTAIVGAFGNDDTGSASGSAYFFERETLVCEASNATTAFNNEANDGFGNWTFTDTGNSGHFIANSATNGDGDNNGDGDINSSGSAWGMFANSNQIAEMIRPFDSPLNTGDTFSIQMDNGWLDPGSSVGFSLRNLSGQNLLEFYFNGGASSYTIDDASGGQGTGIGFTDEGLQFDMTMTSATTVDIVITELFNGTTYNFSKTFKSPPGGQTISFLRMFNFNAGGGGQRNAYFNNLEVCYEPSTCTDADGDGFCEADDCNDNDIAVNPGATEINFNDIDDDCNPDTLDENSGIFESYAIVNNQFYDLMATTGNPDFNGADLGNLTCTDALVLNGAQNKIFKCDTGDVTNGKLFYRVYESSSTPSAFIELNLGFGSNDAGAPAGCQNQTWETTSHDVDVLGSLAPGNYTLEVYTSADYIHSTGSGTHQADNSSANYTASFTVFDDAPTVVCNDITVQLEANGSYTLIQTDIDAIGDGSSDNCGAVTFSVSQTDFDCSHAGANSVTLTVTDTNGNEATCDATVTVEDTIVPTISCPATAIVSTTQGFCYATNVLSGMPVDILNPDFEILYKAGSTTVTSPIIPNGSVVAGEQNTNLAGPTVTFSDGSSGNQFDMAGWSWNTRMGVTRYDNSGNFDQNRGMIALMNGASFGGGTAEKTMSQTLGENLEQNTTYTLTADFGWRNDNGRATEPPVLRLYAGNTLLTSFASQSPDLIRGSFVTFSRSYEITNASINGPLRIEVGLGTNTNGQQLNIDRIRLNKNAIVATPNDNCAIESIVPTLNGVVVEATTQFALGDNTVVWTVTDTSGNTASCPQTITVEDNEAPSVVCNDITVQLDANGSYTLSQVDIDAIGAGSTDACGAVTFSVVNGTFDCSDLAAGATPSNDLFISEYIEGGGNNKCIEIYNGTGAPVDLAAGGYTLERYTNGATTSTSIPLSGTIANGDVYVICNPSSTAPFLAQSDETSGNISFNGDDAVALNKNGTAIDIFGKIGQDPGSEWSQGGNGTANQTLVRNANITDGNTDNATDFPSLGTEWTQFAQDDVSNLGSHTVSSGGSSPTVTLTVTDSNGNTATCTATITVEDNIAPIAVCTNYTLQLDANGNATLDPANIDGGSTDACGIASLAASQTSFDCSHVGTNTVTLTVADVNGNISTCDATVTVEDNVAPTVVCNDITVQLAANGSYTLSQADIDAIGNGSTDACGAVTFSVVNDSIDCNDVSSGNNGPSIWINEIHYDNTGGDVGEFVEVAGTAGFDLTGYSIVLYNGSGGGTYDSDNLSGSIDDEGSAYGAIHLTYPANGLQNGSPDGVALVDNNGNVVEFLSYEGTILATNGPANGMISTDIGVSENGTEAIGNSLQRTGDASSSWTGPLSQSPGSLNLAAGQSLSSAAGVTVTLTVTDSNGNIATCDANVIVEDNIAPNAVCTNYTLQLDANGNATLDPANIDGGSTDACGIASLAASQTSFDCSHVGTNTVTLTVTDVNGNISTCDATVTVEDNVAPTVVCNDITVQLDVNGNYMLTQANIDAIGNGSNDACGAVTFSIVNDTFDCSNVVASEPIVATDLFFSQYIEGSAFNKYIEIYNGTGADVNLSDYELRLYSNGASSPSTANGLSGILANGDVVVYRNSGSTIYGGASIVDSAVNWNGDDAIELYKISTGTSIDIFGEIGSDPGSSWSVGGNTTINATLVRNDNIISGNTSNSSGFPSLGTEWGQLGIDDVSGLGSHSIDQGNSNSPTVTLTVTDVNGNTATCTATVTVEDTIEPNAICNPITVSLDDDGNYTLSSTDIDAIANGSNDACGIASLSVSPETFTCSQIGLNTVTLTVTDVNGNTSTCTTTVTVEDTVAPVVICQELTVQLDASGAASIVAADLDGGSFDTCSAITLSINQNSFDCADVNATVSINDLFFSEYVEGSSSNKYIEIYNGTGANIDLSDYELRLYSNGNTSPNTSNTLSGIIADGEAKVYQNSGATIYAGATTDATAVNWNGDDAIELYKISTGTSIDIFGAIGEDPGSEWNVSGNETADHTLRRNVTIIKGNTNNTAGFPSLGTEWTEFNLNDVSGLGSHTVEAFGVEVILTATDAYGNSSSCTAIVTVEDIVAPIALCQAVTVQLDANGNGSITTVDIDAGSNDACGIASLSLDKTAFDCSNLGANTVTLTVTDVNGNVSTCSAIVTVEDNIAPIVDCLSLQVLLDALGNGSITIADIDGNSTDNCGIADIALSQLNFTCDDIGGDLDELIISEYVDGTGDNNWIEIFNGTGNEIVLGEMVGTSIVSYYSLNVYYDGSSSPVSIGLLGTIADRDVYKISHTNADQAGASGIGTNLGTPDLNFDGNDAIALMNNGVAVDIIGVIGSNGPWANSGVTTNSTTLVRKLDVLQGNINAFVANMASEWNQFAQNTYSNLGGHVIEITDQANNITLTVTDTSGNVSTCVGEVTVVDLVAPVAQCQLPADLIFNLSDADVSTPGTLTIAPSQVDNGSTDACGIAGLALSQTEFTCADVGTTQVTLTVTDRNGNTDTCTTTITIVDDVNPVVLTQNITIQLNANGTASITAADVDNGTSDICGIASLTVSPDTFDCGNVGPNTVTLTATDINGNSATGDAIVTIEDNVAPSAVCNPISVELDSSGMYMLDTFDIETIANGSDDACGIANLSVFPDSFTCADIGANTVTLTVTDNNGNTSSCTTTVTVNGIIPTVTIAQGPLPEFCQGDVVVLTANSPEAISYLWSTGETTESIEVSGNNTVYSVTVTSATNCTASTSFTTSFNLGALISSYTILANEEVFLHGSNLVESGAVGATSSSGLIKLHQASTIVGRGQAANFSLNQGSIIGNQVNQPANPTIPPFVFNNQSNTGSPDVTINTNQSQTLNGSVYDLITVKQNATVTFTQPNVYINDIKTFENATLVFTGCTNVYINEKFMLAKGGVINSAGQNVVFYVNDDVQIEQGSNVRARIHLNGNEILAKGANASGNGNGNNAAQPTYMTGLFIANRVHGNKNVIWRADSICDPCPTSGGAQPPVANNGNLRLDAFDVVSWPNPSDTEFNIKLKTENLSDKAVIKVFDMNNKLVYSSEFGPTETFRFGKELQSGVYLVKVIQGKNMAMERLIKY